MKTIAILLLLCSACFAGESEDYVSGQSFNRLTYIVTETYKSGKVVERPMTDIEIDNCRVYIAWVALGGNTQEKYIIRTDINGKDFLVDTEG